MSARGTVKKRFRLVSPRSQSSAWKTKNGGIWEENRFSEVIHESKEFPVLKQGRNSGVRQVSNSNEAPHLRLATKSLYGAGHRHCTLAFGRSFTFLSLPCI